MSSAPIARRTALKGALAAAASEPLSALADKAGRHHPAVQEIARAAERLPELSDPAFGRSFDRFGGSRVVLLGEATHGTSEFYRARAEITKHLVREHGFTIVAVEADWPDASHVDAYIRGRERPSAPVRPFRRFPTWMWRNQEMRALVDWLKAHNARVPDPNRQVGFYGLDLYGLGASIEMVADHLAKRDPAAADEARVRYACLSAYQDDPTDYAYDSLRPGFDTCEEEVGAALKLLEERLAPGADPVSFDALQNARAVVSGEKYYRTMSRGGPSSWNLRDQHMFDSLTTILDARGSGAKAVVWAHNSHVGNAAATEMSRRGEHNIGQLCRRRFGEEARLIGFGTDRGAVMAASRWGGDPQVKEVRPSLEGSYGRLLREAARDPFWLDLRPGIHDSLRQALKPERLERAIGVLYLPETERLSHYYDASLPEEFDAFLWFEETRAVTPVTDDDRTLPADHPLAP